MWYDPRRILSSTCVYPTMVVVHAGDAEEAGVHANHGGGHGRVGGDYVSFQTPC